jgi:hypothetical protein
VPHACHSGGRDQEVQGLKLQPLGNSSYFKKNPKKGLVEGLKW